MQSKFIRTANTVHLLSPRQLPVTPKVEPVVAHHVLVIDRSGSMYSDMDSLKASIEQALVFEATQSKALTTLISFSTHGDVTLHWSKVPVSDMLPLDNPHLPKLRKIRATNLTGISQALNLALEHVELGQTTGITLFTDGYANSPSAYSENQALAHFVQKAQEHSSLFFNAIGYRDWCDWPRMQAMTNALSGKTVRARSFLDVQNTIRDTQALLANGSIPSLIIEAETAGTQLLAIHKNTGQVNIISSGAEAARLSLRGVSDPSGVEVWEVENLGNVDRVRSATAVDGDDKYLFGALAHGLLSTASIREAKAVLFASGNKTLWGEHESAMTPSTLSELGLALEKWVKSRDNSAYEMGRNTVAPFTLFDLAEAINSLPKKSIALNTDAFYANYRRRSVKRIPGTRGDDGSITPPAVRGEAEGRTYIRGISFNTTEATMQVDTVQRLALYPSDAPKGSKVERIDDVEFIDLTDLKDYRSYTLLASGERNVEVLPIEVYTKDAWQVISEFLPPAQRRDFKAGKVAKIELKRFRGDSGQPVASVDALKSQVETLFSATVQQKLFSGLFHKAEASPYTPKQIEALKAIHVTPALYFSPPTTTHYADFDQAVAKGEVDSYTRYRVMFGTTEILSKSDFRSGNQYLQRRFEVKNDKGAVDKKPTLQGYLNGDTYAVKALSARSTETNADKLMHGIFESTLLGRRLDNDGIEGRLREANLMESRVQKGFRGLVLEIGCTGLLPAELESVMTRMMPEAFEAKYGDSIGRKLKSAEKEAIYYVADNGLVISIVPETSWYTV